jgi:hypothetical protein
MPIQTTCPNCDRGYELADAMQGKYVRCKNCAQVFLVDSVAACTKSPLDVPPGTGTTTTPQPMAPRRKVPLPADDDDIIDLFDFDDDNDEDEERRPARRRQRSDGREDSKRSDGLMIWLVGGGVLAVVLLLGCGAIGIASGWYMGRANNRAANVANNSILPFDPKRDGPLEGWMASNEGGSRVYLVDLDETEKTMGPWELGKGTAGDPTKSPIVAGGKSYPKGLGMHPDSIVKYQLGKTAKAFKSAVTFDDTNNGTRTGDVGFDVYGDGKLLWSSKAINSKDTRDEYSVSVAGVDVLELRTRVRQGSGWRAHAVWLDPYLIK